MKPRAFGVTETALKFPHWQRPVLEALRQKDSVSTARLKDLVAAAQAAIYSRKQRMSSHKRHETERRAMEDAMVVLGILEGKCLESAQPRAADTALSVNSLL